MRSIRAFLPQRVSDDSNNSIEHRLANFLHDDDNHRCGTCVCGAREHLGFPRMVLGLATVIRPTHMPHPAHEHFLPACGVRYDQ